MSFYERLYRKEIISRNEIMIVLVQYPSGTTPAESTLDLRVHDGINLDEAQQLLAALQEAVVVLAQAHGTGSEPMLGSKPEA